MAREPQPKVSLGSAANSTAKVAVKPKVNPAAKGAPAPQQAAPAPQQAAPQVSRPVSQNAKVHNQEVGEMIQEDQGSVLFAQDNSLIYEDEGVLEVDPGMGRLKERQEALAFMEEVLTVQIAETTDVNEEKVVFISVNGVGPGPNGFPYVPRGVPIQMKRKYVEVLCRARPIGYGNVERRNEEGELEVVHPKTTGLKYPFAVLADPNPRGMEWLRKMTYGRV